MHEAASTISKQPKELLNKLVIGLLFLTFLLSMIAGVASGYRLIFGMLLVIGMFAIILLRFSKTAVFFIAMYFPFEEIILKFLPVSDNIYSYLRFGGEILIYSLFLAVIVRKIWTRSLKATPLDVPLVLFVGVSLISAAVNYTSFTEVAVFLRAILRYAFLFYAVANLDFSEKFIKRLITALIIIGLIQVSIGAAQVIIGDPVNDLLAPRATDLTIAGQTKTFITDQRELGSMYGTTGDTLHLALFLMVALALSTTKAFFSEGYKRTWLFGLSLIFFASIAYTFSRGSLIAAIIVISVVLLLRQKKLMFVGICISGLLVLNFIPAQEISSENYKESSQVLQSPLTDFTQIFTNRYVKVASGNRLFIVNEATADVMKNKPLIGFGPIHGQEAKYRFLGDVYWISILFKLGILGLLAFAFIFYKIFQMAWFIGKRSHEQSSQVLALSFFAILAGIVFLNLIAPVSEIRILSIYFWLFAGLLASKLRQFAEKEKIDNKDESVHKVAVRRKKVVDVKQPAAL